MKLEKRTTLHFQEGSSDKVYEVDLCQVSEGRYVVNFRYGRRGSNLKEGTKTTQAVPLQEAQRVFNKLVEEKTKKGYRDVANTEGSVTPVDKPVEKKAVLDENPRKQAILKRLANNQPSTWKLERAIWRAGELKITEATPLLLKLIGTGEPLRDYCIAWALGWCGGKGAIPALIKLYQNASTPEFVSRIAFEALLKLSDAETKAALQAQIIEFLLPELQRLARNGSAAAFATELRTYLERSNYKGFTVLDQIYQIDNQYVRPALIDILCKAPFKPNYFQRLRHIFKMAEYRHDTEVFGILAYRLEIERAMFRSKSYTVRLTDGRHLSNSSWYYDPNTGRYEYGTTDSQIQEELKRSESQIAYSSNTREYLLRRVWRTLKQLGEEGDTDYVKMAVGILLQYSDADAEKVWESTFYRWERSNWTRVEFKRNWDAYAGYLTFNHILYEKSPRYELKVNSKAWRCREGYKPGDPEPPIREEAFPELWEQHPQALLQLLLESKCHPVHCFAVKALRACHRFCASINIDAIVKLVNKPYEVTAQFGFELALLNYNPASPNKELILALTNCLSERARTQACQWIEQQREFFLEDSNFITTLVVSQKSDTRTFARRLLGTSILSNSTSKTLIGRIIAELIAFTPKASPELAKEISETLVVCFPLQLRNISLSVVNDLLAHPILEIQELGARILLNHETTAENLPPQIIESLLASPHESLRVLGIRLFGQLPDEKLIGEESDLIVAMAVNAVEDIRNAIKPIICRLGASYPAFTVQIASDLIEILLTPEKHEGVHSYLVCLLREDLQGWMPSINKETTLNLLQVQSSAVQELGGLLLGANYQNWLSEFTTYEIVKLANHEILSVRDAARQMFGQILNRLRTDPQEMLVAVRMLEAKWEDSREFAFKILTTEFSDREFTPEVLVSICDSVREEARRLGRDLLTRNFQAADGEEYLLKFSEHPSADMQLFTTNYLENYAVGNPERLRELTPFFISVLSRVNRGSVAKKRIFAFLEIEAQKSEAAAKIVAEIMIRQSATMAIGDKAAAIQIMLKIHKNYPQLNLPIQVKPVVDVRN
ncbi:MAG: WGR domain-containing protein [Chlorogloeopsis fritschii C42_A2020_084]|nr:HEAT repeat domain-containing protein [Chlorogloeopsis fritschii]MBF2008391.1 WGR domain-containing protein [Chlorogloeopsis fritschii C42_A2020_084]